MKKATKKLLVCAFVSTAYVVSLFGRHNMSQQITETQTNEIEHGSKVDLSNLKYHQLNYHTIKFPKNNIDVVSSEEAIVMSGEDCSSEDSESTEIPSEITYGYLDGWITTGVNVRTAPNTGSEILEVYEYNTYVSYAKYNDKWSIIKYGDDHAYIYSKYISNIELPKRKKYTDSELYMLSHLIMGEAGGQSNTCQLYVGSVVLNRMKSNKFPDTMKGVIFQKGQYACTWDGNYDKTPTEQCIKNAKYLLEYGSVLPDNVVFQARSKQGKGVYAVIDGEYFCY